MTISHLSECWCSNATSVTVQEALISFSAQQSQTKSLTDLPYTRRRSLQYVYEWRCIFLTFFFFFCSRCASRKMDAEFLTVVAVVVHQDDFFEQVCRRVIDS